MEAQDHKKDEIVFEQDNESAIRMETNGRMSAGQKSRYINIRYFWIKDQTKALEIDVRNFPTLSMLADFFTKPLNGSLFGKFRDVILGYKPVRSHQEILPPDVEAHVGNNDQQLLGRHNVSQGDTSKYKGVTWDVAIVAGKDSMKINNSRKDEFIKSNESS